MLNFYDFFLQDFTCRKEKRKKNYNDLGIDWGNISFRVRAHNFLQHVVKRERECRVFL